MCVLCRVFCIGCICGRLSVKQISPTERLKFYSTLPYCLFIESLQAKYTPSWRHQFQRGLKIPVWNDSKLPRSLSSPALTGCRRAIGGTEAPQGSNDHVPAENDQFNVIQGVLMLWLVGFDEMSLGTASLWVYFTINKDIRNH